MIVSKVMESGVCVALERLCKQEILQLLVGERGRMMALWLENDGALVGEAEFTSERNIDDVKKEMKELS